MIRSLSLTHAVLYGLGVTIGAVIFICPLLVAAAGSTSSFLPLAFALND
ncbi:hypothetical protein [Novosphingobium sp.]|nr:hypothetical protein [Novosphingobium sp.]